MTLHVPDLTKSVSNDKPANFVSATSVPYDGMYRKFLKRALDLTLVAIAMPIVFPLIFVLACIVAVITKSKPFYSQVRVGRDGKHFRMWKLRTMVKDAEAYLEGYLLHNPSAAEEWHSTQKLKNDPRVTSVGRLLRKTSMDELPQIFNVLNGTMSLVGPRPIMLCQRNAYHGQSYYRMRPGITGLWQVSDRNNCQFKERVHYDNKYYQEMSFKKDIELLVKTVGVVLNATGH